ncbi:MAG: DUF721 domain-containing protein [Bacteroidales bacterium]|jgi:predicted nucleic acid-binding Zn ribbon protein|nr:DUF721 domain-containing protein [Bacteroidales bacterium]
MRRKNEQPLKEVIEQFIETFRLRPKLTEASIRATWESIVGALIAKHTTHIYIKKNILFIHINSPAMMQELSYAKTKLLKTINKKLNNSAIDEIIFRAS